MARLILLVSLLISLHGLAKETTAQEPVKVDCEAIMKTGDMELIVKRGCCSHHQGVCGCSNGRNECCDGTLSPSCTCNSIVPVEKVSGIKL